MPTIDPTGGPAAVQSAPAPGSSALAGIGTDGFMNLLVAQLRYQSPLSPSDPSALMEQTSTLAQVEMMQQVASAQQQLLGLQQTSIASSLLGTEVSATLDDGTQLTGVVDSVRFSADGPMLVVDGTSVPLDRAREFSRDG